MPGGQIATTDEVENYPGIPTISGSELGSTFQEHAERLGSQTAYAMVLSLKHRDDGMFDIETDSLRYRRLPSLFARELSRVR